MFSGPEKTAAEICTDVFSRLNVYSFITRIADSTFAVRITGGFRPPDKKRDYEQIDGFVCLVRIAGRMRQGAGAGSVRRTPSRRAPKTPKRPITKDMSYMCASTTRFRRSNSPTLAQTGCRAKSLRGSCAVCCGRPSFALARKTTRGLI